MNLRTNCIMLDPRMLGDAGRLGAAVWLLLAVIPGRYGETGWTPFVTDGELAARLSVSANLVATWRTNLQRQGYLDAEAGQNGEFRYYVDRGAWRGL